MLGNLQTHCPPPAPVQGCDTTLPKCRWVLVDSGESTWSWSSPAADTAMQLQCRAPGRGTLIQWYSCCPLNKGHIAGAGSAWLDPESRAGPRIWFPARCSACCSCQGWGHVLGWSPWSFHPVLRVQSSPRHQAEGTALPSLCRNWGSAQQKLVPRGCYFHSCLVTLQPILDLLTE